METFNISQVDAGCLGKILNLFNDFRTQSIQQGSLTLDNVTLQWNQDVIRLTLKDPPPNGDPKEK